MKRIVSWFSCGAASAIATKLVLVDAKVGQDIMIAYCETGSEHPDNKRFMAECEVWFGQEIMILQSEKYTDTWDVWESKRYISGIAGAPCTSELKIAPRLAFQRDDDIHIFGYTEDLRDVTRAKALREHWPDLTCEFPLIDRGLNKAATIAMLYNAGIKPPVTYAMGFPNANCIPCCKAESPAYWALIRKHFPDRFDRMVRLSRELGVRLTRINKGINNRERIFIDEIPADQKTTDPIAPECDFLCTLAQQDLEAIQ